MWSGSVRPARRALVVGLGGVVLVATAFVVLPWDVPAEVPALILLLPVAAAGVLSGWRIGVLVAVVAGVAHALLFVDPRGAIALGYTQDVVTLVVFPAVAVVVSLMVSRRSIATRAELIGRERMLLLRSVAHDIRSPLNVILAASTELRDGADHSPAVRRRLLGLVVEETERLDRIVGNLLDLGRWQAGALEPHREPVPVAELVESCRARFPRVSRPGDELVVDPALPDVDVDVDPVQLDQVLTNLVENAVRHGASPARVDISASSGPDEVELRVGDNGPGFSRLAREHLFSPFSSTDGSSGLGLTVCRAIVEAHGGRIEVSDRPEGGTCISFTVPRAR